MSIHVELGGKNVPRVIFDNGFKVLAAATETRDEDIRQALLEHIEQARHQCPAIVSGFCARIMLAIGLCVPPCVPLNSKTSEIHYLCSQ